MNIKLIVAVDLDGGIGKNGQMPWPRLKTDMKRFRELTTGYPVIMGRLTAESIGKPLPNRTNIVMSSTGIVGKEWQHVAGDLQTALKMVRTVGGIEDCWIIGGGQIYDLVMRHKLLTQIHVTAIHGCYDCDVFFPKVNLHDWEATGSEHITNDAVDYTYKVYKHTAILVRSPT